MTTTGYPNIPINPFNGMTNIQLGVDGGWNQVQDCANSELQL